MEITPFVYCVHILHAVRALDGVCRHLDNLLVAVADNHGEKFHTSQLLLLPTMVVSEVTAYCCAYLICLKTPNELLANQGYLEGGYEDEEAGANKQDYSTLSDKDVTLVCVDGALDALIIVLGASSLFFGC